jgi:hypothetical protein
MSARDKAASSLRNRRAKLTAHETRMHRLAALDCGDLTPEQEAELDEYFRARAKQIVEAKPRPMTGEQYFPALMEASISIGKGKLRRTL